MGECWKLNPRLLQGEKQVCYLCVMPRPHPHGVCVLAVPILQAMLFECMGRKMERYVLCSIKKSSSVDSNEGLSPLELNPWPKWLRGKSAGHYAAILPLQYKSLVCHKVALKLQKSTSSSESLALKSASYFNTITAYVW